MTVKLVQHTKLVMGASEDAHGGWCEQLLTSAASLSSMASASTWRSLTQATSGA